MKRHILSLYLYLLTTAFTISPSNASTPYYTDSSRYDVLSYTLNLDVSNKNTKISGFTTIHAKSLDSALSVLFVELNPELNIDSILLNNINSTYSRNDKWLRIDFPQKFSKEAQFSCSIFYNGEVQNASEMGGFKSEFSSTYNENVTFSLSEPFASYLWFPCKQDLSDKADSVFVNITVNDSLKVASNGLLKRTIKNPTLHKVRYEWESHYPTTYYLIAVAVAEYKEYSYYIKNEHNSDSLFFQNFMFDIPEYTDYSKESIDKTADIMHAFEKVLIPYPFSAEKYGHCLAPIGGGMENQTMTMVYNFSFGLIAHELAHSWFGDMVTCATWKDIWVNEGMASYFEYLSFEFLQPEKAEQWLLSAYDRALSEPNGIVEIPDSSLLDEHRIFDYDLTYRKGALIVHQLRKKIDNDSLFFLGLRTYLQRYRYSSATVNDFRNTMEEVCAMKFDKLFDSWYYGYGMPQIAVQWNYTQSILVLSAVQNCTSALTPSFDVTYELLVTFKDGTDTVVKLNQQLKDEKFYFPLNKNVKTVLAYKESSRIAISVINSNDLKYSELQLFPNPVKDSIHLVFPNFSANRKIEIISTNGRILGNYATPEKRNELKINLPAGLYILRTIDNGSAVSIKFIKE